MAKVIYCKGSNKFVNPYHFVPLGKECDRQYDYRAIKKENGLLTGWIECELETKSPIFVPNSSNDDVFQKSTGNGEEKVKSYDFFSRENLAGKDNPPPPDRPVIPGSELRGVFRSAFEAVTNSCMSTTDDENVLFKRTTTPGQPGIVLFENGKWYIQPCQERIGVSAWTRCKKDRPQKDPKDFSQDISNASEGDRVLFKRSQNGYQKEGKKIFDTVEMFEVLDNNYCLEKLKPGQELGFLHKGENFINKHHETLFVPDTKKEKIALKERDLENLLHNFKLYADEKINQSLATGNHTGYNSFLIKLKIKNAADLEKDHLKNALVYFKQLDSCLHLCPATIGREVFQKRLKDLIGSFAPCETSGKLCPACALFGFAGEKDSVAGRIRFSDAELISPGGNSQTLFLDPMVLPELASPKPSATEFYLQRPEVDTALWNYDYAGSWEKMQLKELRNYHAKIRGRKFYWHGGKVRNLEKRPERLQDENISKRHVKVRPIRKDISFRFSVHFDEITKDELQKLLWVLSVGNSDKHGHKIGMGKPVGLGSISVKIKDVIVRSIQICEEKSMEYKILSRQDFIDSIKLTYNNEDEKIEKTAHLLGGDPESIRAFLKIAKLNNAFKDLIDYPRLDPQSPNFPKKHRHAAFHWFVGNKQIQGTGMNPVIDQVLRSIDEPSICKIKREETGKTKQQKRNH